MRYIFILLVSALLSACQTGPGVVHDKHTGKTVVHSKRYAVAGGLLHNANAIATWSNVNGYGVGVEYLATGGSWMFFREAWSYGKQYTYVVESEDVMGCGAGCSIYESGIIRISEADFQQALVTGFEFKLVGRGGAFEAKVPAEAFKQVLSQKS